MGWKYCGNYGGPGWSGGEYVSPGDPVNWDVIPVDAVDSLFREHDMGYSDADRAKEQGDIPGYWDRVIAADTKLMKDLENLLRALPDDRLRQFACIFLTTPEESPVQKLLNTSRFPLA